MQRNKHAVVAFLMLLSAQISIGEWLKRYEEDYHRPTYYNRAHKQEMHVDYNRQVIDQRDFQDPKVPTPLPPFNASIHKGYYVHILYKASVFCSGALISRRMIVTSSRCFLPMDLEPTLEFKAREMTVITGNDFGQAERKVWRVKAFFLPASRVGSWNVHDIALIALDTKLDRRTYRNIKLYSRMPKINQKVTMAFVDTHSHDITLYPSKVVDFESCKSSFEQSGKISIPFDQEFFCVSNRKKGDCSTRRGDPLIIDNLLAGINIYGEHCDQLEGTHKVDIYYAIRHAIPYIQRATDLLRAFTGSGPFNASATTKRTQLLPETTTIKLSRAVEDYPGL